MGRVSPLTTMAGYTLWVAIIVLAILSIVTIFWGMRLRAKRRSADAEVVERSESAGVDAAPPLEAPAAPVPAAPAAELARPLDEVAPVAPPPPPLAPTPIPSVTAASVPATPTELTQLKGLGPKVAARLTELGVTRIDQLAALSPSDADALDAQLGTFSGRMARDRWIEQAKLLAAGDRAGFEAAFGRL